MGNVQLMIQQRLQIMQTRTVLFGWYEPLDLWKYISPHPYPGFPCYADFTARCGLPPSGDGFCIQF